jgi:hypothetical protein
MAKILDKQGITYLEIALYNETNADTIKGLETILDAKEGEDLVRYATLIRMMADDDAEGILDSLFGEETRKKILLDETSVEKYKIELVAGLVYNIPFRNKIISAFNCALYSVKQKTEAKDSAEATPGTHGSAIRGNPSVFIFNEDNDTANALAASPERIATAVISQIDIESFEGKLIIQKSPVGFFFNFITNQSQRGYDYELHLKCNDNGVEDERIVRIETECASLQGETQLVVESGLIESIPINASLQFVKLLRSKKSGEK